MWYDLVTESYSISPYAEEGIIRIQLFRVNGSNKKLIGSRDKLKAEKTVVIFSITHYHDNQNLNSVCV